ncbi:MAG: hypothetical protein M1833_001019 [Piccolia ochrophora]|nr:MAG: hypothetical protein M1833_001019 [Piccolia ochrophora]
METELVRPNSCHHYSEIHEVPWDIQNYWRQRHTLFSKYDDNIWLTDDAWFGVTAEPVANMIADHLSKYSPPTHNVLIDAFAGAGGNVIAFACSGRWDRIIAIEKDHDVMQCAKQNATVYGVFDQIEWIEGDCFGAIKTIPEETCKQSVIFASPPWGGPGYRSDAVFDLSKMEPYPLNMLHESFFHVSNELVLYLPRTSDLRQLAALAPADSRIRVVHYCMWRASKAMCVYFGALGADLNS